MSRFYSLLLLLTIYSLGLSSQIVVDSTDFSPADTSGWGALSDFTYDISLNTGSRGWTLSTGTTPTALTGPDAPHEGSHYAYFEHSCGVATIGSCPDTEYSLVSPLIHLNGTGSSLSFYYLLYAQIGMGTHSNLEVNIISNAGANRTMVFNSPNGIHTSGAVNQWTEQVTNLSAFDGEQIRIEFVAKIGQNNDGIGDIGIDSMMVTTTPKPIPTLGEWGFILLLLMVINVAVVGMAFKRVEWLNGFDC